MVPLLIQTSEELLNNIKLVQGMTSLFWIIEYNPEELGYAKNDINYSSDLNRYSFLRTECLKNPTSYLQRLDEKKYRIWTVVPQEHSW